ncbi:MAG: DUF222 domain-containing protein, partial [Actinomycetota bacterium]
MFDTEVASVGLPAGEADVTSGWCDADVDDFAYLHAVDEWNAGWLEPDRHVLPDGLESIPPGPFLAAIVSSVDPNRLNGHDVVRLMQARARLSSHHEAHKYEAISEIAFSPPSDADAGVLRSSEQVDYAAVEVAAALSLTRRSSERQVDFAVALTGTLRRVWELFSRGELDPARVRVFDDHLSHLPEETIDMVLDQILDDAPELTTGQLGHRLGRLVKTADPDGSRASYEQGLSERKVVASGNPDHTANLGINSASPERVAAARRFVEKLARRIKASGDPRTLDQIRNDVALDLLRGKCVHGVFSGGRADITITAETLVGLSTEPGELAGFGSVIAEIAKKTVFENVDGTWTFTVTDQGKPVATGTLSRRPSASQQRQVRAAYPTCV